jgi:CheY-like chemotaxis protein
LTLFEGLRCGIYWLNELNIKLAKRGRSHFEPHPFIDVAASKICVNAIGCGRPILPKTSVLIVDDHEAIRRTLRVRINALPEFSVCGEAINGVDAVEKAQLLNPNLVILDFAMPEMNGLEAATALRFMLPSTKLYLLTAHSNRELELAARDAGIDAVYSKYDDLSALFRRLKVDCVVSEAASEQGSKPASEDSRASAPPSDGKPSIH